MKINELVYAAIEVIEALPIKIKVKILNTEMVKLMPHNEWGVVVEINGIEKFLEYSLAVDIATAPYGKKLADAFISPVLKTEKPKKKKSNGKRKNK